MKKLILITTLVLASVVTFGQIKTINRGSNRPNTVQADTPDQAWDKANYNDVYLNAAITLNNSALDSTEAIRVNVNENTADISTNSAILQDSLPFLYYDTTAAYIGDYYLAPWGSNSNDGSFNSPWFELDYGMTQLSAGDTLYCRGGLYAYSDTAAGPDYTTQADGTDGNRICVFNYPEETPIFDYANTPLGQSIYPYAAFYLSFADYWHIRGLDIRNIPDPTNTYSYGVYAVNCDELIVENCNVTNAAGDGFLIVEYTTELTTSRIINCDASYNVDTQGGGGDADGFCFEGSAGVYVEGCRAWNNSDDGFDWYNTHTLAEIKGCWAMTNGIGGGDGTGFKLGASDATTDTIRLLTNNISVNNKQHGFYQNGLKGRSIWNNNTASNNTSRNFDAQSPDTSTYMTNNLSYVGEIGEPWFHSSVIEVNNSWNRSDITVTAADFISTDTTLLYSERLSDGSLPDIDFLKPVPQSDLVDQGIPVDGVAAVGVLPDIGALETSGGSRFETLLQDSLGWAFVDAAYGDGVTNATEHIQAKIDAVGYGRVTLPNGVFLVDSLILSRGIRFEGTSNLNVDVNSGTRLQANLNCPVIIVKDVPGESFSYGATISDMRIAGSGSVDSSLQVGVLVESEAKVIIENCRIGGFENGVQLSRDENVSLVTIRDNSILSNRKGIYGRSTAGKLINAVNIENNIIMDGGFGVDLVGNNINILKNTIQGNDSAAVSLNPLDVGAVNVEGENINIIGNYMEYNGGGEIVIWGGYWAAGPYSYYYSGVTIKDNYLVNSDTYVTTSDNASINIKSIGTSPTYIFLANSTIGVNSHHYTSGEYLDGHNSTFNGTLIINVGQQNDNDEFVSTSDASRIWSGQLDTPFTTQAVTGVTTLTSNYLKPKLYLTATSPVDLTGAIADGFDGQEIVFMGSSNTNTITFNDGSAYNTALGASTRVLGDGDILVLVFSEDLGDWGDRGFYDN